MLKKAVVTALTTAMAFGSLLAINPKEVKADETGYKATLGYADPNWGVQEWGDNVSTTVDGDGTYTLSWDLTAETPVNGAIVYVVDIAGAAADLAANGKTFELTDLKIKLDGADLAVDMSKVQTGDIEEKGNYRIEIFNEYGLTKENSPIDVTKLVAASNMTVEFALKVVDAPATDDAPAEDETEAPAGSAFDPSGEYMAYLGIQTPNWTYRNAWNDGGYETDPTLWGDFIYGNETKEKYGKVTDAAVKGNGTYKVSLTDFGTIIADDFKTAGQDFFNLLFISTNIPRSEDVKVTNVKIIMDGKTIKTFDEAVLDEDDKEYVKILIQNIWNETVKELPFYAAPAKSVEMQFTIEGFDYDNPDAKEETKPAPTTKAPEKNNDDEADKEEGGFPVVPVVIVVVVVAVVAVVAVVMGKKKKTENK